MLTILTSQQFHLAFSLFLFPFLPKLDQMAGARMKWEQAEFPILVAYN
jgi:hypothetical protein